MKFVMTGHKGLIGSSLLEKLEEQGHEPVLLIDTREGNNIIDINSHRLDEKVDILFDLAAFCKINKTIENPEFAFKNNVLGAYQVMEFCRKNKIPKIVFTSSSRILSKEKNPYTASKIYGEELVKGYSQCYNMEYVIIRPSTVYGPFDDKTHRLVDIFIRNSMQGKDLEVFGNETKTLDFTYVDDFVSGFLLAMKERNNEFNIATGRGIKVGYVADLIINEFGRGKKVFRNAEIAQPQEVEVDISEIKKLGYVPRVSIEEGIRRTADWYKKNILF